jgi:hypothetical protein
MLNARWINRSFRLLRQQSNDISLRPQRQEQHYALNEIRSIFIEMQHIPVGVTLGDHHDFAQMVVRPGNAATWKDLLKEIFKTKREKTLSLWISLAWVVIVQILSIIQFFTTVTADNSVVLGLVINSLWAWMLPLVWGYVFIGTQNFARSIGDAFRTLRSHDITVPRPIGRQSSQAIKPPAMGSSQDEEIIPVDQVKTTKGTDEALHRAGEQRKDWVKFLVDRTDDPLELEIDTFLGSPIAGWERQPGPLFLFARANEHRFVCQHFFDGLKQVLEQQKNKRTVHGGAWNDTNFTANLDGTAEQTAAYILPHTEHHIATALDDGSESHSDTIAMDTMGGEVGEGRDLRIHSGAPNNMCKDKFVASVAGLFLQWGTTGSAIVIAY